MLTATYTEFRPHPALRRDISCYWSLTTRSAEAGVLTTRAASQRCARRLVLGADGPLFSALFPNADQGLAFNFGVAVSGGAPGDPLASSSGIVIGAMTRRVPMQLRDGAHLFGVTFQVGRGARFLHETAERTTDRFTPLADAWGSPGEALVQELANRPSSRERILALDRALLRRLPPSRANHIAVDRAVSLIGSQRGAVSIQSVSQRIGLSRQRLARLFRNEVGVAPKFLCRVARFQAVLARLSSRDESWAALAAELGYYDQAHLIQEFKRFTGYSPGRFSAGR